MDAYDYIYFLGFAICLLSHILYRKLNDPERKPEALIRETLIALFWPLDLLLWLVIGIFYPIADILEHVNLDERPLK